MSSSLSPLHITFTSKPRLSTVSPAPADVSSQWSPSDPSLSSFALPPSVRSFSPTLASPVLIPYVAVSAKCHPRRSAHNESLSTILSSFEHRISPLVHRIESTLTSHNASSEQVLTYVVSDLSLIEKHVKKIAKEVHGVAKHHHKRMLTTDSTNVSLLIQWNDSMS